MSVRLLQVLLIFRISHNGFTANANNFLTNTYGSFILEGAKMVEQVTYVCLACNLVHRIVVVDSSVEAASVTALLLL